MFLLSTKIDSPKIAGSRRARLMKRTSSMFSKGSKKEEKQGLLTAEDNLEQDHKQDDDFSLIGNSNNNMDDIAHQFFKIASNVVENAENKKQNANPTPQQDLVVKDDNESDVSQHSSTNFSDHESTGNFLGILNKQNRKTFLFPSKIEISLLVCTTVF